VYTRREQVAAYQFVMRRLESALLTGEPESTDRPFRRLRVGIVGSVVVAAIVACSAMIFALAAKPSAAGQPLGDGMVVEAETGARYVVLDGHVHPVANLASALLATSGPPRVARRSEIDAMPHGTAVGIVGAPELLPAKKSLAGASWTVCSERGSAAVMIGEPAAKGRPLSDRTLLVDSGDERYLLWHGTKIRIHGAADLTRLGWQGAPVDVAPAFLSVVPAGSASGTLPPWGSELPQTVCAVVSVRDGVELSAYDLPASEVAGRALTGSETAVVVSDGAGALVQADDQVSLVCSDGRRFPLRDQAAQDALGYAGVEPIAVPAALIALMPQGPTLDVQHARQPLT
jgi:type VII secretion protein EccB